MKINTCYKEVKLLNWIESCSSTKWHMIMPMPCLSAFRHSVMTLVHAFISSFLLQCHRFLQGQKKLLFQLTLRLNEYQLTSLTIVVSSCKVGGIVFIGFIVHLADYSAVDKCRDIVAWWVVVAEASLILQSWLDCHAVIMNICIYDAFGGDVFVCVCVCMCLSVCIKAWKLLQISAFCLAAM